MFRILKAATLAAAVSLLALPAHAAVLLTVNVSDASAVTITATGDAADADASIDSFTGVSLLDFFTRDLSLSVPASPSTGTLVSVAGDAPVNFAFSAALDRALNLFDSADSGAFVFETGETAFAGSVTLDLSAFADLLPAAGTMGRIAIGDGFGGSPFGTEFGDFLVVDTIPLPAAAPLMMLGLVGLRVIRRRG